MPLWMSLPWIALMIAGVYYVFKALNHTSGGRHSRTKAFALGIFAPKSLYTPEGWKYRNRGIALVTAPFVVILIWILLASLAEG